MFKNWAFYVLFKIYNIEYAFQTSAPTRGAQRTSSVHGCLATVSKVTLCTETGVKVNRLRNLT
jgi:hypothetical protein